MKDILQQEIDEAVLRAGGSPRNREDFPPAVIRIFRFIRNELADRKAEIEQLRTQVQDLTETVEHPDWRERK